MIGDRTFERGNTYDLKKSVGDKYAKLGYFEPVKAARKTASKPKDDDSKND